jgi:undecaprenyl-diphosphatase
MPGLSGPLLLFDVVVHLGTLLAIAVLLRERIVRLLRAALSFVPGLGAADVSDVDRRWVLLILAGSVPTALIGLGLRDTTEALLERPAGVGVALLVTAALLLISERLGRRSRGAEDLGWVDALVCGVAQGLAVIPGISRSGATVAAALWRDVDGSTAVEFSLLLSMPAVAGAALLVAIESGGSGGSGVGESLGPLLVGFAAALLTGIAAVKALQWVVVRRRLAPFAAYCAIVGVGAIILG